MMPEDHERIAATLRLALADLVNGDRGTWGVLGCYIHNDGVGWKSLDGIGRELLERLQDQFGPEGIDAVEIVAAAAYLAADLPDDACGTDLEDLRGIAIIASVDHPGRGVVCMVDACFDDGWRHLASWGLAEAAPDWAIASPAEAPAAASADHPVRDLLAALQQRRAGQEGAAWPGRFDRAAHEQLAGALRLVAADHVGGATCAVALIRAREGRWAVTVDPMLSEMVAVLAPRADVSIREALESIAFYSERMPVPESLTGPDGLAVLINQADDGGLLGLTGLCDGIVHALTWGHDEPSPVWEMTPASRARSEAAPILAVYQRLLDALNRAD